MNRICIIGGCGHVGIPLGLAFAKKGLDVTLVDVNPKAVENINKAKLLTTDELSPTRCRSGRSSRLPTESSSACRIPLTGN